MNASTHEWIQEVATSGDDWDVVAEKADSSEVVKALDFDAVLRAAYQMLHNDDELQHVREYATDVLDQLRAAEPERWATDWRHEAFLAQVADEARLYKRRNDAWDRTFNLAAPDLTVEFAFLIARMTYNLETSPVNLDEAIRMLEGTMKTRAADKGAARLAVLYRKKGDTENEQLWLAKQAEFSAQGLTLRPLLPPPLENESLL